MIFSTIMYAAIHNMESTVNNQTSLQTNSRFNPTTNNCFILTLLFSDLVRSWQQNLPSQPMCVLLPDVLDAVHCRLLAEHNRLLLERHVFRSTFVDDFYNPFQISFCCSFPAMTNNRRHAKVRVVVASENPRALLASMISRILIGWQIDLMNDECSRICSIDFSSEHKAVARLAKVYSGSSLFWPLITSLPQSELHKNDFIHGDPITAAVKLVPMCKRQVHQRKGEAARFIVVILCVQITQRRKMFSSVPYTRAIVMQCRNV